MKSKGEQKIAKLLRQHKICFKEEVEFKNLKSYKNVPLRFDFAIFENKKLVALIEFDGIQHYKYVPYFHKNKLGFMKSRELDRKKNQYCLCNNIPLIRIPYWDLDIFTFKDIFLKKEYRVINKYHIDNYINGMEV